MSELQDGEIGPLARRQIEASVEMNIEWMTLRRDDVFNWFLSEVEVAAAALPLYVCVYKKTIVKHVCTTRRHS